jgi:flagellar hook assembly protein FlgD
VRTLVNGRVGAGDHELVWDGTSRGGRPVGAGVYFIRARGGNVEAVRKIVLAK